MGRLDRSTRPARVGDAARLRLTTSRDMERTTPHTARQVKTTAPAQGPHDQARLLHYTLPGGWQVLAGRTDADNDRLSLSIAGPNDWWFHIRGLPGSHVLLL